MTPRTSVENWTVGLHGTKERRASDVADALFRQYAERRTKHFDVKRDVVQSSRRVALAENGEIAGRFAEPVRKFQEQGENVWIHNGKRFGDKCGVPCHCLTNARRCKISPILQQKFFSKDHSYVTMLLA